MKRLTWFVLGHTPNLSLAEIYAVLGLPTATISGIFQSSIFRIETDTEIEVNGHLPTSDPTTLMAHLGGTIKIGQELGNKLTEENLLNTMVEELKNVEGKINFGISLYPAALPSAAHNNTFSQRSSATDQIERWGKEIKKRLKEAGRSVRYVFKREATLSSVTVSKNGLDKRGREFLVSPPLSHLPAGQVGTGGRGEVSLPRFAVAKTLAVQPFEDFSARDFGRPGRDDKSGMLPPKLAMMMVNLADVARLNYSDQINSISGGQILDPFCGSGTILSEAMLLGFNKLLGSDISGKAIEDTRKNIEWTKNNLKSDNSNPLPSSQEIQTKIIPLSALNLSTSFPSHSVDAIVTEPYLGPPLTGREFREHMELICAQLRDLYIPTFKEFKAILKPNGVIIFIIPRFKINNIWYRVSPEVITELKQIGFEPVRLLPPEINSDYFLFYHRTNQFVGREIWKFKIATR